MRSLTIFLVASLFLAALAMPVLSQPERTNRPAAADGVGARIARSGAGVHVDITTPSGAGYTFELQGNLQLRARPAANAGGLQDGLRLTLKDDQGNVIFSDQPVKVQVRAHRDADGVGLMIRGGTRASADGQTDGIRFMLRVTGGLPSGGDLVPIHGGGRLQYRAAGETGGVTVPLRELTGTLQLLAPAA
jgi:hypothetical protein